MEAKDTSMQSSGKKRSQPDRRQVFFSPNAVVIRVICRYEFSKEEKIACWYSASDVESFKQARKADAKMIDRDTITPGHDICALGLEGSTAKGFRQRMSNITKGLNAVLDEQELQYLDGQENPDMLAFIYKMSAKKSRAGALKRAKEIMAATSQHHA